VRDEAHRFAIGFQRRRRAKVSMQSILDGINGIGAHRKRLLLQHYGSIEAIKKTTAEELSQLPGISHRLAQLICGQLKKLSKASEGEST